MKKHPKIVPTQYEIHPLLLQRWSARSFSKKIIQLETLNHLFEAASWAASSMNEQPWRFVFGAKDSELFSLMYSTLAGGNQVWAKDAQVLIAVIANTHFADGSMNLHAWHDVGAASTYLLLQAAELGILGHQMGGFNREIAESHLKIPNHCSIVSIIALGYPDSHEVLPEPFQTREITPRTRKPIHAFVFDSIDKLSL